MVVAVTLDCCQNLSYRIWSANELFNLEHSEFRSFGIFSFGDSIGNHAYPSARREVLLDQMEPCAGQQAQRQIAIRDLRHLAVFSHNRRNMATIHDPQA